MSFDVIIQNGKIVDGTCNPWYKANVGVKDGRITVISRRNLDNAERVIDAEGLVVCPGFINPHGHIGRLLHDDNRVLQSLMQGVTVECTGNCGMAMHTMSVGFRHYLQSFSGSIPVDWLTLDEWRNRREEQGLGLNIVPFVGLGTIRASVMGHEGDGGERFKPTEEEFKEMKALVAEGMDDGAFGLTVGLSYQVQRNATTDEIVDLCKIVAKYGGVFMAHARGGAMGTQEFIEICETTPIAGCLSHTALTMKPQSVVLFKEARDRGVEMLFDLYPWIHGSGKNLGFWLFGHQLSKKRDPIAWQFWNIKDLNDPFFTEIAETLKDDAKWAKVKDMAVERVRTLEDENDIRRKVLEKSRNRITVPPIWDLSQRVGVVFSPSHPEFEGDDSNLPKVLGDVVEALGSKDIWDAARELFIADEGKTLVVNAPHGPTGGRREKHVISSYQMPESIVSSDASIYITHPRAWGSWPKILQRYVQELNVLRLEDAIRKMTSLPAQFLGLTDRGLIKVGMWADVVVFDPKKIENRATYRHPRNYPTGIPFVLVNGEVVVDEGCYSDLLPGKVLRMPFLDVT
jgi:N-acyl-D-aspartate/D-glutamate deacylase